MKHSLVFKTLGALSLKCAIKMLVAVLHTEQSEDAHSAFTDTIDLPPQSGDRDNLKTSNIPRITRVFSSTWIAF